MYWFISLFVGAAVVALGIWFVFEEVFLAWVAILSTFVKTITLKVIWVAILAALQRYLLVEIPKFLLRVALAWGVPIGYRARFRLGAKRLRKKIEAAREWVKNTFSNIFGKHVALGIGVLVSVSIFVLGAVFLGSYLVFFGIPRSAIAWMATPLKRWSIGVAFKLFVTFKATWVGRAVLVILPRESVARIQKYLRTKVLSAKQKTIALRKKTEVRFRLKRTRRERKEKLPRST